MVKLQLYKTTITGFYITIKKIIVEIVTRIMEEIVLSIK